jgi:diguanylate cyclase (GGDEF)-like protein
LNLPFLFSISFSVASAIYIFLGIYVLYLDAQKITNRLFFALAMSVSIWSFGFSMAIATDTLAKVLFWRRFAALGFGAFFSIMLHFFIEFTGHSASRCRNRFYPLLYLPTLIIYLGFTYFPKLNPKQYNMVYTEAGWTNIAANNLWDVFYILFYLSYFLTSIFLLWKWGKSSNSPRDKRSSKIIIYSFLFTLFIGALTDTFSNLLFSIDIPQLAPIFIVFPSIVIYYTIRKYGLLNPEHINDDAILMSDQIRGRVSNYISAAFLFAAMVNLTANRFFSVDNKPGFTIAVTVMFALTSVAIQLIHRFIKSKTIKDIIIAAIFSLIVPILIFRFFDSAGTTVWAFPFTLLIVSTIFDSNFIQIISSVSIILSATVMWILKPEATTNISHSDHMARVAIFLSAIWFSRFVSKIFQSKLKENAEQIDLQKLTTEISTEFISISEQNLQKKIDTALSNMGELLKPDRIYIYTFDESRDSLICQDLWKANDIINDSNIGQIITADEYPEFIKRIQVGNIMTLSDMSGAPPLVGNELIRLLGAADKAFIVMPIIIKNKVYGFLGVDRKALTKPWPERQLDFFRIISLILSAAYERIQQEKEIIKLAFYDYLTKLPNRFLFRDRVTQMISLSERTNNTLAIIFLNLDTFKAINDTIGIDGGDSLLIKLAEQLKRVLRKSDSIARFGGDEFLIMVSNISSIDIIKNVVEKILDIFEKPFVINEQEFFISANAGIAVYPYDGKDADSLIKNADLAMYKAKELGTNRYMFCTDDMREEVLLKMRLTNNLFRVIDKQELKLYYQPQVSTKTGRIVGAEALLRWFHPDLGYIRPELFIPLAEQTGLIGSIGEWVLKEACRQCKEWIDSGISDIRIAVNVSFLQLKHPKFVDRVKQILQETKLDAKYLELELTESTAVSNSPFIIDALHSLKEMGIAISIDDFGKEYSSLSRLSTMPIDNIKLDMQFIQSIHKSDKENAIIKSIIELSHILGLNVVAEGVETESQLEFLKEHGSDIIQGYFLYHPVPADEFENILKYGLPPA